MISRKEIGKGIMLILKIIAQRTSLYGFQDCLITTKITLMLTFFDEKRATGQS
jgi:hypothetical protein